MEVTAVIWVRLPDYFSSAVTVLTKKIILVLSNPCSCSCSMVEIELLYNESTRTVYKSVNAPFAIAVMPLLYSLSSRNYVR